MKRFCIVLGFLALLLGMVSCQKDQSVIRATISRYQNDQKVYIDEDNYACWEGDEQVFLNGNTYSLTPHDANSFEIAMTGDHSSTLLNAIYPSDMVVENSYSSTSTTSTSSTSATNSTISTIRIELPTTQDYEVDDEGSQIIQAPMAAQVVTGSNGGATLDFNNICSLLKVKVLDNVFVHSITVNVLEGGISLAGQGTVNFNDKTLVMDDNGEDNITSITLNVDACRSDGIYYVVVPPYATNARLEVVVYDNPHSIIKSGQASGHQLPKNKIVTVNCNDGGKGLFSVANGVKVSFAKGNLTLTGSNYSFQDQQTSLGSTFGQSNINNLSSCMGNDWFILSASQWNYLLNSRTNKAGTNIASRLRARANIGGQYGLILLPDAWDSLGCPITVADNHNFQSLTITQWQVVETYGAVFLPAPNNNGTMYWSTTNNKVLTFANGEGNGGSGGMYTLKKNEQNSSAYIRHAHYVVVPTNTSNSQGE